MNNFSFTLIIFLFSNICLSQVSTEKQILDKILEMNISNSKFYVGCDRVKTFFDSSDFNSQTGLEVPSCILEELETSSKKSKEGSWMSNFSFNRDYLLNILISKSCLEKQDIEMLLKKNDKRQQILLVSEPIFDIKKEHCIVSEIWINNKGSGSGSTYFLKKVYGSWTIISVFDIWIT